MIYVIIGITIGIILANHFDFKGKGFKFPWQKTLVQFDDGTYGVRRWDLGHEFLSVKLDHWYRLLTKM